MTLAANTITTRRANPDDLDAVAVMFDGYRQFYKKPADVAAARSFLADRMARDESVIFLAHAQGVPVGFTQLYPTFSSVSMGRVFVLNDLFVAQSARRRGVGAALLDAAVGHAKAQRAVRLSLNTDVQNASAQALYEAKGWQRQTQFFAYELAT
jgi:ribosomal protein S18 acetylase RimI-like enzyme